MNSFTREVVSVFTFQNILSSIRHRSQNCLTQLAYMSVWTVNIAASRWSWELSPFLLSVCTPSTVETDGTALSLSVPPTRHTSPVTEEDVPVMPSRHALTSRTVWTSGAAETARVTTTAWTASARAWKMRTSHTKPINL